MQQQELSIGQKLQLIMKSEIRKTGDVWCFTNFHDTRDFNAKSPSCYEQRGYLW